MPNRSRGMKSLAMKAGRFLLEHGFIVQAELDQLQSTSHDLIFKKAVLASEFSDLDMLRKAISEQDITAAIKAGPPQMRGELALLDVPARIAVMEEDDQVRFWQYFDIFLQCVTEE